MRARTLRTAGFAAGICGVSFGAFGAIAVWQTPGLLLGAGNSVQSWLENAVSGSGVERALYRLMKLPGGEILYRRSPRETRPELTSLISSSPNGAALYSLRAMEDEQALDFDAAERDWKMWAQRADDKAGANLDLADFYDRRLRPQEELAALEAVGATPASPRERLTAANSQRAWQAWERGLQVVEKFALPRSAAQGIYAGWERRYPQQGGVYERELAFDIAGKDFLAATALIGRYEKAFPAERDFPVTAEAQVAAARGSAQDGMAVYDRSFEPLWPASLVKSYCDLLAARHETKKTIDTLRARLAAHPEGGMEPLKDAARLFYIDQQQGQLDAAKAVLAGYRERKEARGAAWSADELYALARLLEAVQDFPEAARYYYALAGGHLSSDAEEKGLAGLTRILLTAPEQPLRVGAGNLALYKSIAKMDRGPGYLNGILSLWMNSQQPASEYASEDQLASPYFHRAKAAELLADLDKRFPQAAERSELHALLMDAYSAYGEDEAVVREGTAFLAGFPNDSRRVAVALQVADVYSRTKQYDKEFALYRELLKELSTKAGGVPLGGSEAGVDRKVQGQADARSAEYAQVLDRFLSRLVSLDRLPEALELLRGELDRNPQDPGLYEKLADFLTQNRLNAHVEEVYQRAISQFQQTGIVDGWYGKLARFYLRERRREDYSALTRKVTEIFSGTELQGVLRAAPAPDEQLALQVVLYAHRRFPHDLTFVRGLLNYYRAHRMQADLEKLLWEHWWESPDLRDELFERLSSSGRLDEQLAVLRRDSPEIEKADWSSLAKSNPAAERFWLESCLWQSRFEDGVSAAEALAAEYPADEALGRQASSLNRSLAYFHPEDTDKAVAIEQRLLSLHPGDLDTLARIGDIYADRGRMAEAAPYWEGMAVAHPSESEGYLQSATVFWDYFDFSSALAQLRKGRDRMEKPALFGYQIGSIAESQGDMAGAVREYVTSALADTSSSESRERLLVLARRPQWRAVIEAETSRLLDGGSPAAAAIDLRVSVLDAERRSGDMASELKQAVARTDAFDALDALTQAARTHSLPEVEEAALGRQIALTADPVHRLELRYQLVDLLGRRKEAAASTEIEAIDRENPKILGVVRATVDYDWNHDHRAKAVAVLLDAARVAYPDLKRQFSLEGAHKLTDIGEYQHAKSLLEPLLAEKPLDSVAESALADNYARSGDTAGLKAFYSAQLAAVKDSKLERGEKTSRLAELRRGMIGAATLLRQWDEATDQYIALINAYPGDASLIQEAALYAGAHDGREKLLGFYRRTVEASPRDARWSIALAQMETALEDLPAAIDAYGKAIRIRPEQKDLYQSKAAIEERLYRLDDAIADYAKLYTLSYHDPQWMVKTAEARARQGRGDDAVKALEEAWIAGHPRSASGSFRIAEQLEQWSLLDQARKYAEEGLDLAGDDLLVDAGQQHGAAVYARIMARLRQSDAAFTRLAVARMKAENLPISAVAEQVAKDGFSAVTAQEWRQRRLQGRKESARQGFSQALSAMAGVVHEYGTPEEKSQFAAWLQSKRATAADGGELRAVYLPAIQAAGFTDMEADLLWEFAEKSGNPSRGELGAWVQFQRNRVQLEGVGPKIEKLAESVQPRYQQAVWLEAAQVYRDLGDATGELRALDRINAYRNNGAGMSPRYYELLLATRPQELIGYASSDQAAQFLVRNGKPDQAFAAIAVRSRNLPPVWKKAYTGLTGLYLRAHQPEVRSGFDGALEGEQTIGERIAHPADRNEQLAGEVWFYYASRYGEYLDEEKDPLAEGYLEAELEHTPERSEAYFALAAYSAEAGRTEGALADYQRSLDLHRDQPEALDAIALLEWKQGRQSNAIAAWQSAVKLLAAEMDARHVPETFWGAFAQVLGDVASHGQYAAIAEPVDAMLRVYLARNGEYRAGPLLQAGYHARGDSLDWLIAITGAAHDQTYLLSSVEEGSWIAKSQRSRLLGELVEMERNKAKAKPEEGDYRLKEAERRWIYALLNEKRFGEARVEFSNLSRDQQKDAQWIDVELRLSEAEHNLPHLVAQWKEDPSAAPSSSVLQNAVLQLSEPSKRVVMRFVYERALDARELTAANFLGLAAIDLDEGDTTAAVALLKRLTLVGTDTYADTDSAAGLLEAQGHFAEAIPFLQPLAAAFPWKAEYKTRLSVAQLAVDAHSDVTMKTLAAVAADPRATYAERLSAARAINGKGVQNISSGSGELDLFARGGCPRTADAEKPFYIEARRAAASCTTDDKSRERMLRAALAFVAGDIDLRLHYALAAFGAGQQSRALIAVGAALESGVIFGQQYGQEFTGQQGDYYLRRLGVPAGPLLKPEEAAKLAASLIRAYEKRSETEQALSIVTRALDSEQDPARRHNLEQTQKRLRTEVAREQENQARAPNIHAAIEQDRVVLPRLLPGMSFVPRKKADSDEVAE